jgi:hypothetical protein
VSSVPDERRDLARIDAALAEGRVTASEPRERELEELALALRDDAPQADPAFARRLDDRVAEGFARPRRFKLPATRRGWVPVLAGATAVLAIALVTAGVLSSDDEQQAGDVAVQPAPTTAEPSPPTSQEALGAGERRVERTAQMTIAAPGDEFAQMADGVGRIAEAQGGYVVRSSVTTGDEPARGGSFELRIPTKQLETALAELGRLGDVRARSETAQDMTAPYRGVEKRLGEALVERRAMQDKLDEADGPEAEALREQLRALSGEIDSLSEERERLRRKTVFSTVNVTLEEMGETDSGGVGGAFDDVIGTLEGALVLAIRVLGVALPLALLALLARLAAGVARRRRREAALL